MRVAANYYPVVAFDLDGTLLRRTTVLRLLAEHLGQAEAIAELDRAFTAGEISNRVIADQSAAWFDGRTTSELRTELAAGSWIHGIDETLQVLSEAGVHVASDDHVALRGRAAESVTDSSQRAAPSCRTSTASSAAT